MFTNLLFAITDEEHRPVTEAPDDRRALLEKRPGIVDCGRAQSENEWRLSIFQEFAQLRVERLVRRTIEREPRHASLRWPVGLGFAKHPRKESERANGRMLPFPKRMIPHRCQPEVSAQFAPLRCPGFGEPTGQFQHGSGGRRSEATKGPGDGTRPDERWLIRGEVAHRLHDCRNPG